MCSQVFYSTKQFPWVQIKISQHWFIKWLGAELVTSHYRTQQWSSLLMHICIYWPWHVLSFENRWTIFQNGNHVTTPVSVKSSWRIWVKWWHKATMKQNKMEFLGCSVCVMLMLIMDHPGYGLSQWEALLHCNIILHWLSPYPEWFLLLVENLAWAGMSYSCSISVLGICLLCMMLILAPCCLMIILQPPPCPNYSVTRGLCTMGILFTLVR